MWASRAALGLAGLLALGACDRPMGMDDGISPVAGVAPRANVRTHTVDPDAGRRAYPNPGGDGQRAAGVIDRYQRAAPAPAPDSGSGGEVEGGDGEE